MKTNTKIAYFCDGLVPGCSDAVGCYRRCNPSYFTCRHTTDPAHAINGACKDPENHPERFNKEPKGYEYDYWEGDYDWPCP